MAFAATEPRRHRHAARALIAAALSGLLLSSCNLSNPVPAPLMFVYQAPQGCAAVKISLGGAAIERLTLSAARPRTVYFTGEINRESPARTDTFSLQCSDQDRPPLKVSVTTPAFPSNTYSGQTLTVQDSAGTPSGLVLVSLTAP